MEVTGGLGAQQASQNTALLSADRILRLPSAYRCAAMGGLCQAVAEGRIGK